MDTNKIMDADVLDLLFDNRNKKYGAYELRKNYHKRARNAVIFVCFFAGIIVSSSIVAGLVSGKKITPVAPLKPKEYKIISIKLPTEKPRTTVNVNPPARPKTVQSNIKSPRLVIARPVDIPKPVIAKPVEPTPPGTGPVVSEPIVSGPSTLPSGGPAGPGPIASNPIKTGVDENAIMESENIEVYPSFPGGEEALEKYLANNIHYPNRARENNKDGRVVLEFVVNKNGGIENIKIVKGIGYGCDDEAMRVVGGMPKWNPGKNNGHAVNVYFNLPITFELDGKE